MTENSTIKLIKNLEVTDLAGEKVMIDFATGKYFLLKGSANDIWDYIQSPVTVNEIQDKLLSEYDVESDVCHNNIIEFLKQMKAYEFIEIIGE